MAVTTHQSGAIETIKDSAGTAHALNAEYLNGVSGTGYVTVAGEQTVTGKKTFSANTVTAGIDDSDFVASPSFNVKGNTTGSVGLKIYFSDADGCLYYIFG